MATIDQLYARIILDTNRDDLGSGGELEQARIDAVADSVEQYADELFWFNRMAAGVTLAAAATTAIPAGARVVQRIVYQSEPLVQVPLIDTLGVLVSGPPAYWAMNGANVEFYPIPDQGYATLWYGIADLGVPASGNANAWTTSGYRLILAAAKKILYRGSLRDPDGMQLAAAEEAEALAKLRRETRRRGVAELRTDVPARRATFNITRGW